MITVKSPEAKKVLAEYLREHDPEFLELLTEIFKGMGPTEFIRMPEIPELRRRLTDAIPNH